MGITSTAHEIKTLLQSFHPLIAIETVEEDRVELILKTLTAELGLPLFEWSIVKGLRTEEMRTSYHGTSRPLTALQYIAGLTLDGIFLLKDFAPYLDGHDVRRQFRELCQKLSHSKSSVVITGSRINLPEELSQWTAFYRLNLPTAQEIKEALRSILKSIREQKSFTLDLDPKGLEHLVNSLGGFTLKQVRQVLSHVIFEDGRLSLEDIRQIQTRKSEALRKQGLLELYPFDGNHFRLGGFTNLKEWLKRAYIGFSDKAKKLNLRPPKGILLVGVQGCGKSLAAKFIAREWELPLLKLEAGRLYDKFIGETEKNFQRAVEQSEAMAPCVLWIDEIEKGFISSSGSEADGGLSYRLLGAILTWLQEKKEGVFLVATANNINALPPELLRKGRFDEVFFVDLPNPLERGEIFRIHLELKNQNPEAFDFNQLIQSTQGFSGAEIEQVIISALYRALYQEMELRDDILLNEIHSTVPLSKSKYEEIGQLRNWAKERFVGVS